MRGIWVRAGSLAAVWLFLSTTAWGQATTSLRGIVSDQSGAIIPKVAVTLVNVDTAFVRTASSGPDGVYEFSQVLPGKYRLTFEASGFRKLEKENLQLLVNYPATVNVTLEVGAKAEVVSVTAEAPLLNSSDASLGVAVNENQVKQLPLEARNVADLYSMQPGVVYLGNRQDIDLRNDTRSGAVNGARSDQSNITLDGVDANDEMNGYAFTSVLRTTPDAMQEFRVSTTNYNADQGRSSGAQVAIVTKGGTNSFHGSLYEYNRNTSTSANDWFIKRAELSSGNPNQAPKLIRNIFGGSAGGPIKKDRAFFFVNFEGRRDRQEESVVQRVPSLTLRQGEILYNDANGGITQLTTDDLAKIDPLHKGADPAVLTYFQSFPPPNDTSVGDGLNFIGYRFPGRVRRRFDTYVGRFDYKLTSSGNQTLFWRGNMQNDANPEPPFLPGRGPLRFNEDFSRGFVLGHSAILGPNLVNSFHWGFTRQSQAVLGDSTQPWNFFRGMDQGVTRTRRFTLPVHNFVDDLSWVKGSHSFSFGGNVRFLRNRRLSLSNSFSRGVSNSAWVPTVGFANTTSSSDPAANGFPAVESGFENTFDFPLIALLGSVTEVDATYNYDKKGNLLPQGAPIPRHFGVDEYEFYFQDAFRFRPNLTVTYGLRYEIFSPPWETTGLQVAPKFDVGQWFQQRGINGARGIPSSADPTFLFNLAGPVNGGRGMYDWDYHNFAPRLAFAYSPRPSSNFLKHLFGEGDKTSIRAGFGIVYDRIGTGLLNTFDQNGAFGLATTLTNPAAIQTLDCAPRLMSLNAIPSEGCKSAGVPGANIFLPAPNGGFPQTPPSTLDSGGFSISWGMDNSIKTPYSYMLDFSISRELPKNFTLEAAYVGHLGHRLLAQEDVATPLNLVDPKTGIDYFSAASRFSQLALAGTPASAITPSLVGPTAPYWQNMMAPLGNGATSYSLYCSGGLTPSPLVAAYDLFDCLLGNETTSLFVLDYAGQGFTDNLGNDVHTIFGPNAFYNPQYSSLYTWRSISNSAYHAMQLSLRKRAAHGLQFDLNYTWSKSIDLESDAARIPPYGGYDGEIVNAWRYKQLRGVSDFDATHQINANWILELPFGKGKSLGGNAHGALEALIGGWQLSGLFRWTTGLPFNVDNGFFFPVDWELEGTATLAGRKPVTRTTEFGDGTVNLFADPKAALSVFRNTFPGGSGARNQLRGDGYFGLDSGLSKRWKMPYNENHSLQFRWEVFNVPNSVRFNVLSNPNFNEIDVASTFGNYTGLLTSPRVMQFALRYEF